MSVRSKHMLTRDPQPPRGVLWAAHIEAWGDGELFAVDFIDVDECDPPCVSIDINDEGFIELNLVQVGGRCTHVFTLASDGEWKAKSSPETEQP